MGIHSRRGRVVTTSKDNTIRIYDTNRTTQREQHCIGYLVAHKRGGRAVRWDRSGLWSCGNDGAVLRWELAEWREMGAESSEVMQLMCDPIKVWQGNAQVVAMQVRRDCVLTASCDGRIVRHRFDFTGGINATGVPAIDPGTYEGNPTLRLANEIQHGPQNQPAHAGH